MKMEKELGIAPKLNELFDAIPDECVLHPNDLSELLNLSQETVRRWCRQGKLPAYSWGGKYVILGSDVKDFLMKARNRSSEVKRLLQ
ncbi:helix-turn-helix domain-containing protein [Brevibacillus parabrevis]|uniref:helix-turn-helix domain-containing protein n=2 Tax=Brevibacillus TaxID=55080 RepID=UPI003D192CEB